MEDSAILTIAPRGFHRLVATALMSASLAVGPASAQHQHGHAAPTYKAGNLVITAPWARATPKGAPVAGGYLTITNNGNESDRLIGGSFPDAGRVEVHSMSMDNGVMRMRPLERGLEIKPGQTIALKPGGMHLMFLDFEGQLKAGGQAKGTLVFEKAGPVAITYQIAPMGAPGPKRHH